jgi:hypothetical protein
VREVFDVVGLHDDIGGAEPRGFSGNVGGGLEPVRGGDGSGRGVEVGEQLRGTEGAAMQQRIRGGDLNRGGVLAGQQDCLPGPPREVAEFGLGDCGKFRLRLGGDDCGELSIPESVECAPDPVSGFDDGTVGDEHAAVVGQMWFPHPLECFGEGIALTLSPPAFAVGLQSRASRGGMRVRAPGGLREIPESLSEPDGARRTRAQPCSCCSTVGMPSPSPHTLPAGYA